MCAGAGKTYSMLKAAQLAKAENKDVVIGFVETHRHEETEALLKGLEIIPLKKMNYPEGDLEEMDLAALLTRRPQIVVVDELAHTNVPGSRHIKRYQDVLEILEQGIDVYTAVSVLHLESRAGTVHEITGLKITETVPDSILENADSIELIDISPDELLKRVADGKVFIPENAEQTAEGFFRKGNLIALRELSLRLTAELVDQDLQDYMHAKNILTPWRTTEKLMVAVGPSPSSEKLIRWTRRVAFNLESEWIAVSVDLGKQLSEKSRELLSKNLELAKELGAKIIHIADNDVVDALLKVAKENNVSQIVIGKTNEHPLATLFSGGNLVDRLIRESDNVDIYVVKADKEVQLHRRIGGKLVLTSKWHHYLVALIAPLVVGACCLPFRETIGYQNIGLIYLFALSLLSLAIGRGPLLLAALANFVVWGYFFIPPYYTFQVHSSHDLFSLFGNLVIALVSSALINRIRKSQIGLKRNQDKITILYSLLESLNNSTSIKDTVARARNELNKFFDADLVVYLKSATENRLEQKAYGNTYLSYNDYDVAFWALEHQEMAGKFTSTMPNCPLQYFPLMSPHGAIGVMGISYKDGKRLGQDRLQLLRTFINQVASSIDREIKAETIKQNLIHTESEKLFQTVLNTVSHELKTPISVISQSVSILKDEKMGSVPEVREQICEELQTASGRLGFLVENILDMSRIESGYLKLKMEICDINDLIGIVLQELKNELKGFSINITVQENLPMIQADMKLLKQAMINIVHNSVNYSGENGTIGIKAKTSGADKLVIEISDSGKGVPPEALARLFDKFYRTPGSKAGGTGLGLTITKAIVDAHQGRIFAANKASGGLKTSIELPLEKSGGN